MDTDTMGTKTFPFDTILAWYEKNGRHDLPWRQIYNTQTHERLYKVWIAEVMLQQTQVDRVIDYYVKFLTKYPTIESLASTTFEELFPYYQGLGYYGRARRMIKLAKVVVENYGWIFPDDVEKLGKLPWIGNYTAQALLAFGYDKPVLAIDANLQKIFARYYFGDRSVVIPEEVWKNLEEQMHRENISGRDINNALMDFWALVSTTFDKIERENYPLKECLWFTTEGKNEPIKKKVVRRSEKWAKLVVFLHETHKVYWSSISSHFEPFLIEPTSKDDRRTVQDYFSATFDLEVSVRPSFWSGIFEWIPVKLFHAQIQTGTPKFKTFSKREKEEWVGNSIVNPV